MGSSTGSSVGLITQPLHPTAAAASSAGTPVSPAAPDAAPEEAVAWMEIVTESENESGQAQVQLRVIDPVASLEGATGESATAQQSRSVHSSLSAVVDLDTLD